MINGKEFFRLFNIIFFDEITFDNIKLVRIQKNNEDYYFANFTSISEIENDMSEIIDFLCLLLSISLRKYIFWFGTYQVNNDGDIILKRAVNTYSGQITKPAMVNDKHDEIISFIKVALNNKQIEDDFFRVIKSLLFELSLTFEENINTFIGRKLIRQWIVLESLINYQFSRNHEYGDFIIDVEKFRTKVKKEFQKDIRAFMKNNEKIKVFYDDRDRKVVYSKIDELNRYPFLYKWDWFVDKNQLKLETSKEEIKKINTKRNKLMHSGFIPRGITDINEIEKYEVMLEQLIIHLFKEILVK